MKPESNKKTQLIAMGTTGLIITSFLFSTTFLYIDNNSLKEEIEHKKTEVRSLITARTKLEQEIQAMNATLGEYEGKNKELNSMLLAANKDLASKKERITTLIKENASLEKIRREYIELKKAKIEYIDQLKNLEKRLQLANTENSHLMKNYELLQQEYNELLEKYTALENRVIAASVLEISNITVAAEKQTKSGKFIKVRKTNKADRLAISFELPDNKIADKGQRNIYVQIKDSKGKLVENAASGKFTNKDENLEVPYTVMTTVDYSNKKQRVTVYLPNPENGMEKGKYKLNLFTDGKYSGSGTIELK